MGSIRSVIRSMNRNASAFSCLVTVEGATPVSAGFVRVTVSGEGLAAYREVLPADAFKIMLPPDGHPTVDFPLRGDDGLPYWPEGTRRPVLRAFTVRRFDRARLRLEFDVMRHHGGVATTWLNRVGPGDVIGLSGMRRDFHPGAGVTRHLIVGDASALPAVAAILDAWPAGTAATVYLAADDGTDRALVPIRDNVELRWVDGASPTGTGSALERAVRDHERPGGRIQAWICAEAGVVRGLRRWVLNDLGVARDDLHASAYWRAGLDMTEMDAFHLGRYERVIASGAEAADPDTREAVEFEA